MATFNGVMRLLAVTAALLSFVLPSANAQTACPALASTIARTLCDQPQLQTLLEFLERSSQQLQQLQQKQVHCTAQITKRSSNPQLHGAWLLKVAADFNGLQGVKPQDYFGSTFTQRADELAYAQALCAAKPAKEAGKLEINTIDLPESPRQNGASSLLFVRTTPPLVGQRITSALFSELLGIEAPTVSKPDALVKALAQLAKQGEGESDETASVRVIELSRSSRYLMLQVETSSCQSRCWFNTEQRLFDLRSGDLVEPLDLLNDQQRRPLNRLAVRMVRQDVTTLQRGEAALWSAEGKEALDGCVAQWRKSALDYLKIAWLPNNRWQFEGPTCPQENDAMPPAFVGKPMPLAALAPYLSAYGNSLLLNVGDVRTPVAREQACTAQQAAIKPRDPAGWAARVADISVGSDHAFLREASGRVWGWGRNYNGAVGNGDPGDGGGSWVAPFVMKGDYLYAGAGQGFSASVRRDGSLWTWGDGYGGKLGYEAGSQRRPQSQQIGADFALADVGNYGGRALGKDGRLWVWGGSKRPGLAEIAQNVVQVSGSIPVLVLQQGGNLLAINQWDWPSGATPNSSDVLQWHGSGFTQLPRGRNLQLAWKADGTAWAWGRTLGAMATPKSLPGLEQSPWPRFVGHDWVDVKASSDSHLIAARKADGSLWVSQWRGSKMRMQKVGCGYADMAFAYDEKRAIQLLALRSDGSLQSFQSSEVADVQRSFLERKPQLLAKDVVKLFVANDYWGNIGGTVLLLRRDGTLWQWYWRFAGKYPEEGVPVAKRFEKIVFPAAWFEKPSARQ